MLGALVRGRVALSLSLQESAWFFSWSLLKIFSVPLELRIIVDVYRSLFLARVCLIAGRVLLFSYSYMGGEPFFLRFHLLVLRFVLSI